MIGCGGHSDSCWCDADCATYSNCCTDYDAVCGGDDGGDDDDDDAASGDDGAGQCCYSADATCDAGDVCCLSGCSDPATCSYTETGCTGHYGQIHNCEWVDGTCIVGAAAAASFLA